MSSGIKPLMGIEKFELVIKKFEDFKLGFIAYIFSICFIVYLWISQSLVEGITEKDDQDHLSPEKVVIILFIHFLYGTTKSSQHYFKLRLG